MSSKHPIIVVTGTPDSGTSEISRVLRELFRDLGANPVLVQGSGFHRHASEEMRQRIDDAEANGQILSRFGPEANLLAELQSLFMQYGNDGSGMHRHYVRESNKSRMFGPWTAVPEGTDLLYYEGMHGAVINEDVDIASHADLLIGMTPVINMEWMQKIHRDTQQLGYDADSVKQTVLRRMHDYVHTIVPQFSLTDINFQRIPTVDTSDPLAVGEPPTLGESAVVIRFRDPDGVNFTNMLSNIEGATMSRRNTLLVPGASLEMAMKLILAPRVEALLSGRGT